MSDVMYLPVFTAILPEVGLALLVALVLVLDLVGRERTRRILGWVTAVGLVVLTIVYALLGRPADEGQLVWGGMLRFDASSFVFRLIFLAGAALTCLFVQENRSLSQRGEFYALLLISTMGMSLMASAADLVMLYLAIETTSIPLYLLSGFLIRDRKSVEAGVKYLLFGAMTSAIMLYGFSLLYGFAGTTQLYVLAERMQAGQVSAPALVAALLLVVVGFGFKISAVPFHFWAPDVYEGAPTSIAGFLSTASKAAGFAVLLRVMSVAFAEQAQIWTIVVGVLAVASMVVGNFLALAQKNIKRLLAYSSIAQAGYMLIGVAAYSELGNSAAIYYLMAYLVTNLAAFGIVAAISSQTGSEQIADYRGLNQRSPGLALVLAIALLSLGGIPPFAGFFAKLWVFAAALQSGTPWLTGLVLIGIANAVLSLYYYLVVLKRVYQPFPAAADVHPGALSRGLSLALVICAVLVVAMGVIVVPGFDLSSWAGASLLVLP